MAEYIDKEQLKNSVKRYFKHLIEKGKYKIDVLDANADILKIISELPAIERLPAADVVPVVRCKDCKLWKNSGSQMGESWDSMQYVGGCEWTRYRRYENDFCSYGERKDNGKI